jgi:flavin-dependent dehydrogenase
VRDLLVVGGGPAGIVTALYARRAGLDVALAEPRRPPIDKACGEGLMPGAVAALNGLDVHVDGHPFAGIRYRRAGHEATARFRNGTGRGVRRAQLHAELWRTLTASGVDVVSERITDLRHAASWVEAGGVRARYVVGADGLHSGIRRGAGLAGRPAGHRRWGQRAHFALAPWSEFVEVYWSAAAEAYVTPVAPDCVGVAVLSATRAPFPQLLTGFPELRARLQNAATGPIHGAGPLRQHVRGRVAGRVLLVGDAAGYADALTGEGLAIAFACARALVHRVVAGDPQQYETDYRRITRRYRWLTGSLVTATRARPVRAAIVPMAQRMPRLFAAAVNELSR